ncbi:hypothetical protein CUJ83_07085 [Methanocella sp. CWC-04]|uniref:Uncharacterized protein n=1 Tax=Methanooceanicella nereidis TaxID=2052831 RepID=A0AAP2W761_9EURY|nr:hypothetical protein [Methanocella sp. CWC-04]MCD1294761.1 hypothetical protein [Methanocella sp. CWC-04]
MDDSIEKCKYLIFLDSWFCRLKGQKDPNCEKCSILCTRKIRPEVDNDDSSGFLKRIKIW